MGSTGGGRGIYRDAEGDVPIAMGLGRGSTGSSGQERGSQLRSHQSDARMNGLVSLIRLSVKISECTESDEVGIPAVTPRSSCGMPTRMQPHF